MIAVGFEKRFAELQQLRTVVNTQKSESVHDHISPGAHTLTPWVNIKPITMLSL